jgi:hypothetical protein
LCDVVDGHVGVELVGAQVDLCSDGANPASVGINDTAADGDANGKTKLGCRVSAESANAFSGAEVGAVLGEEPLLAQAVNQGFPKFMAG